MYLSIYLTAVKCLNNRFKLYLFTINRVYKKSGNIIICAYVIQLIIAIYFFLSCSKALLLVVIRNPGIPFSIDIKTE